MYLLDQAYLPIDYIRSRELCPAVDTFCYGIFMFELVCGRSPSHRPPGQGTDIIITYFTYIMIIIKLYNTLYLVEVLRFRDWNRNRIFVIFHELMIPIPAKIDFLTVLESIPAVSSLVVHKRLWSSNYISNCIFTLRKCSLKRNWSSTNICGRPMN